MAYEMIERLKTANETTLLELLANHAERGRKQNNKQHEVWELSFVPKAFGKKDCRSNAFIYQKLDYMHNNSFVKKWDLCSNALEYIHSSAKFYLTGEQGYYPVTNFM